MKQDLQLVINIISNGYIQILKSDDKTATKIEKKDYIDSKLKQLEKALPTSYLYIIETIYNNKTQNQIAKEYDVPRHTVSKAIKKGYNWLKEDSAMKEYEQSRLRKVYDKK